MDEWMQIPPHLEMRPKNCGRVVVPEDGREVTQGYQLRLETAPVLLCRFLIIDVKL